MTFVLLTKSLKMFVLRTFVLTAYYEDIFVTLMVLIVHFPRVPM